MRFQKFCLLIYIFLILMGRVFSVSAQDSSQVISESTIKVYTEIEKKQVPLNRTLKFTVRVEWVGDLGRYKISELENPLIENFDIYSTSTADRRMSEGGVAKASKIYEFTLTPKTLGMGYVESVVVKYIDTETGEGHHLITNRLDIEVIDSIPDPVANGWMKKMLPFFVLVLVILVVVCILLWRRKQKISKETEIVEVVPLEEEFLTMLKESIDPNSPDLNVNENFSLLSKILRNYLTQKYEIAAMELTSDELVTSLKNTKLPDDLTNNIKYILQVCDLAKFAGSDGDRNDFNRMYTLVEEIFEKKLPENNNENHEDKDNA